MRGVVQGLFQQGVGWVRVVDNESTDATAIMADEAGAEVLQESEPGYGRACWRGLQTLPDSCRWILFCDADGSDDLKQLPLFFEAIEDGGLDFVLGDRRCRSREEANLGRLQNFGNGLATGLIRLGWGQHYSDLGPLRLIRRSALEQIGMKDRTWGWTLEMQVRAVEEGMTIRELPVNYLPRQGGESKISGNLIGGMRAGWVILRTLGALYLTRHQRKATS